MLLRFLPRPDVRLDRLENDSPEGEVAPVLSAAHAFQIGASRDELAPEFFAHAEFLARCPNLLVVSSNGAGYDTIDAPFVGNGFTRWVDGQFAFRQPELGLSNWQSGRLFARGGVLSGDSVFTVRTVATVRDHGLHR